MHAKNYNDAFEFVTVTNKILLASFFRWNGTYAYKQISKANETKAWFRHLL